MFLNMVLLLLGYTSSSAVWNRVACGLGMLCVLSLVYAWATVRRKLCLAGALV